MVRQFIKRYWVDFCNSVKYNIFTGAQCNEEIVENIVWKRTPAVNTIAVQCPGNEDEKIEFQEGICYLVYSIGPHKFDA